MVIPCHNWVRSVLKWFDLFDCSSTGLGTWRSEPGQVQNIVKEAILNHGYRAFDGAWIYRNENEVGNGVHEAIEESQGKIKREDLFITTKLWNQVGELQIFPVQPLITILF